MRAAGSGRGAAPLTPQWWRPVVVISAAITSVLSALVWHSHALPEMDAWAVRQVAAQGAHDLRLAQDITRVLTVATLASVAMLALYAARVLKRTDAAALAVLAPATTVLADRGLKVLVARRAPESTEYHFPSGHVAVAATVLVSVLLIGRAAVPRLASRLALSFWAGALLLLMTWSRMADTAHVLTDVVAGTAMGTTVTLLVAVAVDRRSRLTTEEVSAPTARR